MEKKILNEVHRISELMGVNQIISEAQNPIIGSLAKLSNSFKSELLSKVNEILPRGSRPINDINKIPDNVFLTAFKTLSQQGKEEFLDELTNNINLSREFENMNLDDIITELYRQGIDASIGGMWAKRYAIKNKVNTLDNKLASINPETELSNAAQGLFGLQEFLTPSQKNIVERAANEITQKTFEKLSHQDRILLSREMGNLAVDLENIYAKIKSSETKIKREKKDALLNSISESAKDAKRLKVDLLGDKGILDIVTWKRTYKVMVTCTCLIALGLYFKLVCNVPLVKVLCKVKEQIPSANRERPGGGGSTGGGGGNSEKKQKELGPPDYAP